MLPLTRCFHIGLFLTAATLSARAGSFSSDFNSGAPTGATLYGNSVIESSGGVGDSGCLKLTKNIGGQSGGYVLDDLDNGQPIFGFDISYDVLLYSSGTPADGMSLCYGPDLPNGTWGEEGTGIGLRFCFDTYDNGNEVPLAPSIDVAVGGTKDATSKRTIATITTNGFVHVHIRLNPDGSLNFDYRGQTLFTNYFIPQYQELVNAAVPGRFGFGGRTGGSSENAFIDNLQITTFPNSAVGMSQQPFSQTAQQGDDVAFDVRVANTNSVTYQWYSNNVAIAGATSPTLTLTNVQPAASGSIYKAIATGTNNAATSTEVTLTVTNLALPSPAQLAFNFDDGLTPGGVTLVGTAMVDTSGGIGNSACLKLVNPSGSAAMLVADPNPTLPLYGFTARFKTLVGGGTIPPADGFAVAFGSDIPDSPSGNFEEGVGLGSGLIVTFDIYNNDSIFGLSNPTEPQPAPSIDVRFGGAVLATRQLPISFMETGLNDDGTPAYKDTIVQLNPDGTINVVYHGDLVFDHLPLPSFASIGAATNASGSRFAIAARTGGLNDNIWLDNFELTTLTTPGTVRITQSPVSQTILVNHGVTNLVAVNDPTGVTFQWYRNGTNLISGATEAQYVIPAVALTDNGAVFTAQATKSSISVTSAPATLTVANLTAPSSPQFSFNFDDGLVPSGTGVYGNGYVAPSGGTGNSGVLHLTDAVNSQNSAFVVSNLVFNGAQVNAISVSFDVREGGGSGNPADGFSFNWAADLTDGTVGDAETGTGSGVSLCFRRYTGNGSADNPPSPYIGIKYKGTFIATTQIPGAQLDTDVAGNPAFRTMLFRVDSDGKAYLSYGERVLYNGLQLPNFTFVANSKFGFYGRTGGENNNQWFDNVKIQATQGSGPLTVSTQPADVMVLAGQPATFTVALSDPNNAIYQWQKNGANIPGATLATYTTPPTALSDSGALFKVNATGPSGSASSSAAMLTVVAPITISNPLISYNFDDCAQPADTTLTGTGEGFGNGGYIAPGGIGDSCCIHLTDAAQGEHGTFIIPDLNNNAPVKAFTVYFAALFGGAGMTVPPADGFSLSFCSSNDVPANTQPGEGGIGNGLIFSCNLYNGGNPYYRLIYQGAIVATKYVPYTDMVTGNAFADTYIRLNANGTVDAQFNGKIIFNQVVLPGYSAAIGSEYVLAGRTGGLWINQWIDNVQIATTTGFAPVPLNYTFNGSGLRLSWSGAGLGLWATPSLSAPITWTNVAGATSPYQVPLTGSGLYYCVRPTP